MDAGVRGPGHVADTSRTSVSFLTTLHIVDGYEETHTFFGEMQLRKVEWK